MAKPKRPRDPMQLAKLIGDIAIGEIPNDAPLAAENPTTTAKRKIGAKGGKARAAKLRPSKRREIARKGAAARWKESR